MLSKSAGKDQQGGLEARQHCWWACNVTICCFPMSSHLQERSTFMFSLWVHAVYFMLPYEVASQQQLMAKHPSGNVAWGLRVPNWHCWTQTHVWYQIYCWYHVVWHDSLVTTLLQLARAVMSACWPHHRDHSHLGASLHLLFIRSCAASDVYELRLMITGTASFQVIELATVCRMTSVDKMLAFIALPFHTYW